MAKDVIMPEQSSEIKINYDTSRWSAINKTVFVTTNEVESKMPTATLYTSNTVLKWPEKYHNNSCFYFLKVG